MTQTVVAVDHRFADLALERGVLEPLGIEVRDARGLAGAEAVRACADAEGVLLGARLAFDAAAIGALRRCRVIVRYGIGVDNVDAAAAAGAGVWVANVPDYCVEEVAEHAIAMLLALHRRLAALDAGVRAGRWGIPDGTAVRRLSTCVLGLVGLGRIGRTVAGHARALGMQVLAHDPVVPAADVEAAGARPAGLDELLGAADFVSLHAPLANGRAILDAERIDRLKPGACLINVARGGLVDEPALVRALEQGRLAGAALDVAAREPLLPPDPLLDAPNVILTPHAAWYSLEAVADLRTQAAAEAARVLGGGEPLHPVNTPKEA